MTVFEHAMFGAALALGAGVERRQGWGVVAAAGVAAAAPDWDGLSLLFGANAYSSIHRVWGHNFLVAAATGAFIGAVGFLCWSARRKVCGPMTTSAAMSRSLAMWTLMCMLAGLTHPPIDALYSGPPGAGWPVQVYWPFAASGWSWPVVPWGDLGTTVIFVAAMFAVYRWPRRAQLIAVTGLLTVAAYVSGRACIAHLANI